MSSPNAREHLTSLAGHALHTATRRKPNRILSLTADSVIVATEKSPMGQPVPIDDVQRAFDRLSAGQEVRISVRSLGYRSAFVGAVMLSLPGAELLTSPRRVRLATAGSPR